MSGRSKSRGKSKLTGAEFDELADSGSTLEGHVDWGKSVKIVNVSLPTWMVKGLDAEAQRLNVDRQAVIKTWLAERLDRMMPSKSTAG